MRMLNELGVFASRSRTCSPLPATRRSDGRTSRARWSRMAGPWTFATRFDRYLGAGRPAVPRQATHQHSARRSSWCIDAAGSRCSRIPAQDGNLAYDRRPLPAVGLDGVEVIHPSHSAEDRARLLALTSHFWAWSRVADRIRTASADGIRVVGAHESARRVAGASVAARRAVRCAQDRPREEP